MTDEQVRCLLRPSVLLQVEEVYEWLGLGTIRDAEAFICECVYWEDYEHAAEAQRWINNASQLV